MSNNRALRILGLFGPERPVITAEGLMVELPATVTFRSSSSVPAAGLINTVLRSVVQGYGVRWFSWRNRVDNRGAESKVRVQGLPARYPNRAAGRNISLSSTVSS